MDVPESGEFEADDTRHEPVVARTTEFDNVTLGEIPNYRLGREIGRGGMSVVYAGTPKKGGAEVAIKILYPYYSGNRDLVNRLRREIEVLRRFDHPNIVRYLDSGERRSCYYFVMEFLHGESLEERLQRERYLPEKEACRIILGAARGLAEAHRHQIFHRDVKPGNIFLNRDGTVKLMDFGLAKDETDAYQTQLGLVIGTPLYLAPEQARGERDVDARADIYALGVTLFHCVTGHVPYEDLSVPLILTKKTVEPVPSPKVLNPHLSDNIAEIIRAMSERDVDLRYADIEMVIEDLERNLEGNPALWPQQAAQRRPVAEAAALPRPVTSSVLADPILKSVIMDSSDLTQTEFLPPDHVIFLEGDRSKDIYLMVSGEVEVLKAGLRMAVLNEAGTFFGEMSALLGIPRSTTIRTRTSVQVIRIDEATFENFLRTFPTLNYRMAVMLAERLEKTTREYYKARARLRHLTRHLNVAQSLLRESEDEQK